MQVMPAPGKPFAVFAQEQDGCKSYAQSQIGGAVQQANNSAVGATALGAGLGAALGAALGGGQGAGLGAASGALLGGSVAADNTAMAQFSVQQLYDNAFAQCMYSKGNQVPGFDISTRSPVAVATSVYDANLVMAIQTELHRIGWLRSNPDGIYGPRTRSAITGYEQNRGLFADGIPSDALLDDLRAN